MFNKLISFFLALIWLLNGLYAKLLGFVPRHQQIVSRILGTEYANLVTKLIGIAEILMAIWILSGYRSRLNAIVQILIVATMNILEFFLVPDLLLWGKWNAFFALIMISIIYLREFILYNPKPEPNAKLPEKPSFPG